MAPAGDDLMAHWLLALKHEGANRQVLAAAAPDLRADKLAAALAHMPNGHYVHMLCGIWDAHHG